MSWVEYDAATGRILRVASEEIVAGVGAAVLQAARSPDPAQARVDVTDPAAPVLVARPAPPSIPAAIAGGFSLAGLPDGTEVAVIGPRGVAPQSVEGIVAADGAVSVAIPAPGLYQIRVAPPLPGRAAVADVTVTAGDPPVAATTHLAVPVPLAALQAQAVARVDAAANALSELLITPGPAMGMIYLGKRAEAQAVLSQPIPDDADPAAYPLVAAEAAVDGVGMGAAATVIATRAGVFTAVGAIWDRLRLEAKRDIRAATDIAGIEAAEATVTRAGFEARLTAAGIDPALVLTG